MAKCRGNTDGPEEVNEGQDTITPAVKRRITTAPKGMRWVDLRDAVVRWQAGDEKAAEEPILACYFLTVEEAARIRGLSVRTIRRRIATGKLKTKTIQDGGKRRRLVFLFTAFDSIIARAKDSDDRKMPWPGIVKALLEHYGEAKLKLLLNMSEGDYPDRGNQRIYAWIRGELPREYYREILVELMDDEENDWQIWPGEV